jgi:hypothetical protein
MKSHKAIHFQWKVMRAWAKEREQGQSKLTIASSPDWIGFDT